MKIASCCDDFDEIERIRIQEKLEREDNHKFARDEFSGAYVFKADAMPRRFDKRNRLDLPKAGAIVMDTDGTRGDYGRAEWYEELNLINRAYGHLNTRAKPCDIDLQEWLDYEGD